jgi:hypothetical protein
VRVVQDSWIRSPCFESKTRVKDENCSAINSDIHSVGAWLEILETSASA